MTGALNFLVRNSSDTETNIVSVERVKEYSEEGREVRVPVTSTSCTVACWEVLVLLCPGYGYGYCSLCSALLVGLLLVLVLFIYSEEKV